MHTYRYDLRFVTPAFLGNANQQGQWRTPPIKALLRQWWRVAYMAERQFNADAAASMRRKEAILFGHAWLEDDVVERKGRKQKVAARQSQVRLRLSHWNEGKLKDWPRHSAVSHPEVRNPVGSDLYLGFGPLTYSPTARSTGLKANTAIQTNDSATLSLAVPDEHANAIHTALALMNLYGTLGGRSRNGWGSFSLTPADGNTPALPNEFKETNVVQPWQDALRLDWPHAIGSDARGALIWQTAAFDDWKKLMQELARLKIALRTQFKFSSGKDATTPEDRHWLSYPVTNHSVKNWSSNNARLPNSLRFKVRPAPGNPQQLLGATEETMSTRSDLW